MTSIFKCHKNHQWKELGIHQDIVSRIDDSTWKTHWQAWCNVILLLSLVSSLPNTTTSLLMLGFYTTSIHSHLLAFTSPLFQPGFSDHTCYCNTQLPSSSALGSAGNIHYRLAASLTVSPKGEDWAYRAEPVQLSTSRHQPPARQQGDTDCIYKLLYIQRRRIWYFKINT